MTSRDLRALVADYEHDSRHDPRRFMLTTAALAVFGYAAIVALLAASAWGLAWGIDRLLHHRFAAGVVLLVLACGSLLLSLLRALWMRAERLDGLPITRREAPRLFELVDRLVRKTGAPRPQRVLIAGELNAAVVQTPRLGLLGWHRNDLVLGLPLMAGLGTRQLAAVIAHEFGHLQGAHGKLGAWIYRTRRSWILLALARQRAAVGSGAADWALGAFFGYFLPRFDARAFVLSRQQEYEADRSAHRIVGARPAAEGLQLLEVQASWLQEEFWPRVWRRAAGEPSATGQRPYAELLAHIGEAAAHPRAATWLKAALKRLPDPSDTHPSLRERLDFARQRPGLPTQAASPSAAQELLGAALPDLVAQLDARWRAESSRGWNERHRHANAQRHLIEELRRERARGPVDADDHLLWARAAHWLDGESAAEAVLRQAIADRPDHLAARFDLGLMLADAGDAGRSREGAALLRELAERGNHPWSCAAARRREAWLEAHEAFDELKRWRELVRRREAEAADAMDRLQQFDGARQFEPHGLSRRTLRALQDVLRGEKAVARAFAVRKVEPSAPDWRYCVVVVERARLIGQPDAASWWAELQRRIDLPCPFMVIDLAHPFWRDAAQAAAVREMRAVRDAQVYAARG